MKLPTGPRTCIAFAAALLLAGCPMLQDRLMFFPTRAGEAEVARILRFDPRIAKIGEWQVAGEWLGLVAEPVTASATPRPTALVFHGNAGWAGDRMYYVEPLVSRGYRVVLAEYPGYGPRPGEPTVAGALAATEAAVDAARLAWPGPLVLVGESLGAGLIAQLAKGREESLAGLVLVTPWDSLRTVAQMHYGWLPIDWVLRHPLDSVAALKDFRKPVTLLVAGRDEIVGAAGGERLARSLGAQPVVLHGAGHNDWLLVMSSADWDALLAPMR